MQFKAVLLQAGKTATGIVVPEAIVTGLGTSKKPAVSVTFNGFTYRSTIASLGGKFMIPVSADIRKNTGAKAGNELDITVELDTAPREVAVPDDLATALKAVPAAEAFFGSLSYSNKLRHVLSVTDAKTEETRQRRIEKVVATMAEGKI
jgi:hypothetical protein